VTHTAGATTAGMGPPVAAAAKTTTLPQVLMPEASCLSTDHLVGG